MLQHHLSIRAILVWTISLFGLLSLLIALVTGSIYRDLTLKNQEQALERLITISSKELLNESRDLSTELGMSLQSNQALRKAVSSQDIVALQELLENQFHQYFMTAHVIEISQLTVFDAALDTLSHFSSNFDTSLSCPNLINEAKSRTGPERLKTLDALCTRNGLTFHSVLVPIGGLRIMGYVEITSAPVHFLKKIEQTLGNPVKVTQPNGSVAYQSSDWPDTNSLQNFLDARVELTNAFGEAVIAVSVCTHINTLFEELNQTRNLIILGTGITTLIAIFIALLGLRITTLKPLTQLKEQIQLMRKDPIQMRRSVDVRGTEETRELAKSFNQMTKELNELYQSLQDMAYRDKLTGLPNRNFFHARLDQLTATDTATPFSLLLIDLDRFKSVNDTLGHHIGDKLLTAAAERFRESLRTTDLIVLPHFCHEFQEKGDIISRIGGDEFAVILPETTDPKDIEIVCRKLIQSIKQNFQINSYPISIGLSTGISVYPRDGDDMHTLMRHADIAMYHAKSSRCGYAFYEPSLEKHKHIALNFESDLKLAINREEFELFYQPKLNRDNQVVGAEALTRWIHPEVGLIPPDQFIPAAEKTGLIHPFTHWVISEAIEQCLYWQSEYPGMGVSINVSAISLQDPELIDVIRTQLATYPINPRLITLELTETAVMRDPEHALMKLKELSLMGLTISIDDFGTGYSSLAYLKKLPVNEIKIDRSFVIDMTKDRDDEAIVRSIISLAESLSLTVVAEGVETEEARQALVNLNCDTLQGYLFSRPLQINDFLLWLKEKKSLEASNSAVG